MAEQERPPAYLREHQLQGESLLFALGAEDGELRARAVTASDGRAAKTLVKEGPLRITLVALRKGTTIQQHDVAGPVSIQCIRGSLRITTPSGDIDLTQDNLLSLGAGVTHTVNALDDCSMLITFAMT